MVISNQYSSTLSEDAIDKGRNSKHQEKVLNETNPMHVQDTSINKYSLTFKDKQLEKEFRDKSLDESMGRVKAAILLAATVYLLFFIRDYAANPTNYLPLLINRLVVFTVSIIYYFISSTKIFRDHFNTFAGTLFFVSGLGTIHAIVFGNPYISSTFLVALFFSLVPFNSFRNILIQNFTYLVCFYLILNHFTDIEHVKLLSNSAIFLTFILVIVLIFYTKQKTERESFILSKAISDNNKVLKADKVRLQNQAVLARILHNSTDPKIVIEDFLQKSLEIILDLPWLNIKSKGSIFATNKDGNLEMVAEKDLGKLTETCALIKPGQCLCGKALSRKELQFNSCVTEDHDIRPEGITPHGHYNVPLMMHDNVLGVLNLYVPHNHVKTQDEVNFLTLVTDAMALVMHRSQMEKIRKQDLKQIIEQKKIIERSYDKINESIAYAQRIQNSMLASNSILEEEFEDNTLLYLPKETVSGDFYMARKKGDLIYIAVADCTGHGVPEALISALGTQELSHIIEYNDGTVGEMLDKLNINLNKLINNDDMIGSDGMDLTLLCIDKKKKTISYAGAKGIFYLDQSAELVQLKTDRVSIGQNFQDNFKFTTTTITYSPNDNIHLLSDGLMDQISGVTQKRIGSKQVKAFLKELYPLNKSEKQEEISTFINTHHTDHQTDDITLLNLKLC